MKEATLCTLALGLAMSLNPGVTYSQTHCKGLTQERCSPSAACKWVEARPGGMNKSPRRAHCRLDTKAAARIAAEAAKAKGD